MSDVLDSIARIRMEFLALGLKPPVVIRLVSHEEGYRFLSSVRQSNQWITTAGSPNLGKPVLEADGTMVMEIEVMGVKVRWPADRLAKPDGSWAYI